MIWKIWLGRILCGLVFLFLAADAITHILKIQPVLEAFQKLSIPENLSVPLGILVLIILALLVYFPTRIAAAVLLTGYLGGAVAIHLRSGSTPFEIIFPIIIGTVFWSGLYLNDARARTIFGLSKN